MAVVTAQDDGSDFLPNGPAAESTVAAVAVEFRQSAGSIARALREHSSEHEPSFFEAGPPWFGSPSPLVFATYFDLLRSVLADDVPAALGAQDALCRRLREPASPFLSGWDDFEIDQQAVLLRHLNDDPMTRLVFTAPTPRSLARAGAAVDAALALFDQAAPEIAAEIRTVVREIILVAGTVNENLEFDGATSFTTWGALFLNADRHGTRIEAVDGLSHESAHAVLFGRSFGEALVENPEDERYRSPLRADSRPLDGIFHAAFVSARMHYAHERVLASGLLDEAETATSQERLRESRAAFEDGYATLRRHARPTALGARLLDAAAAYMATA